MELFDGECKDTASVLGSTATAYKNNFSHVRAFFQKQCSAEMIFLSWFHEETCLALVVQVLCEKADLRNHKFRQNIRAIGPPVNMTDIAGGCDNAANLKANRVMNSACMEGLKCLRCIGRRI